MDHGKKSSIISSICKGETSPQFILFESSRISQRSRVSSRKSLSLPFSILTNRLYHPSFSFITTVLTQVSIILYPFVFIKLRLLKIFAISPIVANRSGNHPLNIIPPRQTRRNIKKTAKTAYEQSIFQKNEAKSASKNSVFLKKIFISA